jgi:hypothetical protein
MDYLIDYIAVFPDGNNEILKQGIKKCNLIEMAKFIYELYYTDEGKVFKSINNDKMQELLQILLQETNRRSQEEKDKQLQQAYIEDKENININPCPSPIPKGQLNYTAEEYIPYSQDNFMNEIKNNIYTFFTYHMDVDGFTPIESFCKKYNITLEQFIDIAKNDEHIQLTGDKFKSYHPDTIKYVKFKSYHPTTMKHIKDIISWTQNNIYKIFNDKNNYYYKYIKNEYLPIDLLMKDQQINKYFSSDTLILILKEDCRFGLNGRYLRTTI